MVGQEKARRAAGVILKMVEVSIKGERRDRERRDRERREREKKGIGREE